MSRPSLTRDEFVSCVDEAMEKGVYTKDVRDRMIETYDTLSDTDELTGLYKKHVLEGALRRELKTMQRAAEKAESRGRDYGDCPGISVLYFDLNEFKDVNDRIGHQAGDVVLKQFGVILQRVFSRETDLNSRNSGDEYASLLRNTDEQAALQMLGELEKRCERRKQAFYRLASMPRYAAIIEDYMKVKNRSKKPGEKNISLEDLIDAVSNLSFSAGVSHRSSGRLNKYKDTEKEKDSMLNEAETRMYTHKKERNAGR